MTSRREFIKKTCSICVALGGIGVAASLLESCSSIPLVKASPQNNKISVPVNSFKEKPFVLVRSNNLDFDILLVKKSEQTFSALKMQCTHQQQPLSVSGNGLHCAAHGSSFDLDGNVTQSPATIPLTKYIAAQNGDSIIIQLT